MHDEIGQTHCGQFRPSDGDCEKTNPNSPAFQHGVDISLRERTECLSSTTFKISTVVIHTAHKSTASIGLSSPKKQGFCSNDVIDDSTTSHLHSAPSFSISTCLLHPFTDVQHLPSSALFVLPVLRAIKRGSARVGMEVSSVSRLPWRSACRVIICLSRVSWRCPPPTSCLSSIIILPFFCDISLVSVQLKGFILARPLIYCIFTGSPFQIFHHRTDS